jgi:hypothetical protein
MPDIMLMGKNPNYLGSWDLYDIPGQEIIATIKKIQDEEVINNGQKEGCTVAYFEENYKPMILNLTNKKMLARLYKTKSSEKIVGKKIKVGFEKVKAFGKIHDALRIKNEIPKETTLPAPKCEVCGKDIFAAYSMNPEQLAAYTLKTYGKKLCSDCAMKAKKEQSNGTE